MCEGYPAALSPLPASKNCRVWRAWSFAVSRCLRARARGGGACVVCGVGGWGGGVWYVGCMVGGGAGADGGGGVCSCALVRLLSCLRVYVACVARACGVCVVRALVPALCVCASPTIVTIPLPFSLLSVGISWLIVVTYWYTNRGESPPLTGSDTRHA